MLVLGIHRPFIHLVLGLLIVLMLFLQPASAAQSQSVSTTLSIQPITWDVIGLDSNDVNAGPSQFLVGARVCNIGENTADSVVSNFVWDSANPNLNLVPGSYTSLNIDSLAPGACTDFYYNVEITRSAVSYNALRRYRITAQAANADQVATPNGRQLYVEKIVSQNRNSITSITCPLSSPPAGTSACKGSAGNYTVMVGQTYEFTFVHNTATQGYEQIESFVNFPNLLFQIVSVSSTYSEPAGYTSNMLYQDACGWDPINRDCVGPVPAAFKPRGTAGGSITSRYRMRIIAAGAATVSGVIYDFSGSSFHYNSDFGTQAGSVTITAVTPPDLSLTKSDQGASAAPGGDITYTLAYANTGGAASGVMLNETVPTNTTFNPAASSAGWACLPNNNSGSICTLNVGAVNNGAGGTAAFTVTVNSPLPAGISQITNSASVADDGANGADANPGNNNASDSTPVNAAPDLRVTKTDGGATAAPGGTIAYTLAYQNSGNQGAAGVVLTETVPANTIFNPASSTAGWTCSPNNNAGSACTLTVGALNGGAGGTAIFAVTAASTLPAGVTQTSNTAIIADDGANGADPTPGNNTGSDTTPLNAVPDLTLTKTGPASALPAGTIAYTLAYQNIGNQGATGVTLTETVPVGTAFDPTASAGGWTCTPNNNAGSTCSLAVGSLAAGANGTAVFAVRISSPVPAGLELVSNQAGVADDGTNGADPTPENNTSSASTQVTAAPDLRVIKSDGGQSGLPGANLTYTLQYGNHGSQNTQGVWLEETVPANTTYEPSANIDGWTCVPGNNAGSTCTLAVGSLNAGQTGAASFTVKVNTPLPAGANQTANMVMIKDDGLSGIDLNPGDNTGTDSTPLDAAPDLSVTKSDGGVIAGAGESISYILSYANTGTQGASNVTLTETIPAATTFDSAADTAGWFCLPDNNTGSTCTLNIGSLAASSSGTAVFAVRAVNPLPEGVISTSNTVLISDDGTNGADLDSTNNSGQDTTGLSSAPDLSISKDDGAATTVPGGTIIFTLTFENAGTGQASGVVLSETVPASTTFIPGASTPGWVCLPNNNSGSSCALPVGALNAGAGGSAVFAVAVINPLPAGVSQVSNTASIVDDGSNGADTNPSNNTASDTTPLDAAPDLSITKTDGDASSVPGGTITYTLSYRNGGSQDATGVVITETVPANTTFNPGASTAGWACAPDNNAGSACALAVGSLPAGGALSTAAFAVTVKNPIAASVTGIPNTASIADDGANGGDLIPGDNSGSDSTPVSVQPLLSLSKTAAPTTYSAADATITYTYTLTNTGNVTLTAPFSVTDDRIAAVDCAGAAASLAPTESTTCTAAYTITLTDMNAGSVTNTATASGTLLGATVTSQPASATVTAVQGPQLALDKQADRTLFGVVDELITYTYTLTNAGNVTLSGPFTVADDRVSVDCAGASDTLVPGGSTECTAAYTVTQTDLNTGSVTNLATATGFFKGSPVISPQASETVEGEVLPSLELEKTADPLTYDAAGDVISYSYLIRNNGNVTISGPFRVTDDRAVASCPGTPASLAPGGTVTCTAAYTITQTDVDNGSVTNTAYAAGSFGGADVTSPEDSVTVSAVAAPALTLEKTADPLTFAAAGDEISYTYTLRNDGNVTITGPFSVTDNRVTVDCAAAPASLAPARTATCTATYTITQSDMDGGSVTNTATAYAAAGAPGELVSNTDQVTVTANQAPELALRKDYTGFTDSDSSGAFSAGDRLNYTLTASNSGNVTLTGVSISDPMLGTLNCTPAQPASLVPGASLTCAGSYALAQSDLDGNGGGDGDIDNTASADSNQTSAVETTEEVPLQFAPVIGAAKRLVSVTEVSAGTFDVTFVIRVENMGSVALSGLQVLDDLAAAFPAPTTFTVRSLTSTDLTVNSAYNGRADTRLLTGADTLAVGEGGELTLVMRIVPAASGPFKNSAIGSGSSPSGDPVSDISQDGPDADPDKNGDPTDNNEPTPVSFGPGLFDPPMGIKTVDASGAPALRWTMVWINNTNIAALNAVVSDPIPSGSTFIAAGASSGYPLPAGAPAGSTSTGVTCTDTSAVTTTTLCYYEGPTTAHPRGRVIWQGTLGPDFGVTSEAAARNALRIAFNARSAAGIENVSNTATIDADLNGDGDVTDSGEQQVASASATWQDTHTGDLPGELPSTGFAPDVVTDLSRFPRAVYFHAPGDLRMEIPALKLDLPVIGVPLEKGEWNLAWLWQQAGWLEGTAFPTWKGNSVLTGHVYLPSGLPGPFVNLKNLAWGDKIIVHAFGQRYVYQVREIVQVDPDDTSVLAHEDQAWLTLLTCKDYDAKTRTYRSRLAVRAVLMEVK